MIVSKKTLSVPPAIILERGGVVSCLLLSGIFLICCCCGYPLFIFSRITGWALKTPENKVDIFMEASLLNKRWIAGLCNSSWPEPGKRRRGGKGGREEQMDGEQTDGRTYGLIDGWMDGWMTFMDVCFPVTAALQENRQYFPALSDSRASLRRFPLSNCPSFWHSLYICFSFSLRLPPFYVSLTLSPLDSLPLSLHTLWSIIHIPSLTLSFFPMTPEIPPSAAGRSDLQPKVLPSQEKERDDE